MKIKDPTKSQYQLRIEFKVNQTDKKSTYTKQSCQNFSLKSIKFQNPNYKSDDKTLITNWVRDWKGELNFIEIEIPKLKTYPKKLNMKEL